MTKDEQVVVSTIASGKATQLQTRKMRAVLESKDEIPVPSRGFTDVCGAMAFMGDISRTELWKLRKAGLPSYKIGSRVLFHPSELEDWIRNNGQKLKETK